MVSFPFVSFFMYSMRYLVYLFLFLILVGCNTGDSINGDDLYEAGDYHGAIAAYTSYLETHPDHIKSLYNRGRSYEEMGNVDDAVKDFEHITESDPKNINAYLSLSKIFYNKSAFNKVLVYTSKAIDLNENSSRAHFFAGRAEHQLGYLDQALESYNNALSINKDYGEAYLYRGAVKMGKENTSSACEDFKLARSLGIFEAEKAVNDYCK